MKLSKLLNNLTASTFLIKKWIAVNDLFNAQYSINKNIRFKIPMLGSELCDYNNAYTVIKGKTVAAAENENDRAEEGCNV